MDTQEKILEEHVKNLPEHVRAFVDAGEWQKRTEEVAQKYSLSVEQTDSLINDTYLVLVGIIGPEDLQKSIEEDVLVSSIISEQILEDLEKRVFEFALKSFEKTTGVKPPEEIVVPKTVAAEVREPAVQTNTYSPIKKPETAPDVDLTQKIGIPRYVPTKVESLREEESNKYESLKVDTISQMQGKIDSSATMPPRISYRPSGTGEPVQTPPVVPRLNLSEDSKSKIEMLLSNKMNSAPAAPTTPDASLQPAPQTTEAPETPKSEIPIVKSYTVDPYREPIA